MVSPLETVLPFFCLTTLRTLEFAYAWRFGAIICGEVIIAESVIQTGQ